MNEYFIHSFELALGVTYEDYCKMRDTLKDWPEDTSSNLYPYICTEYKKQGITIKFRACNEKERIAYDRHSHILLLEINPSRMVEPGTYENCINDEPKLGLALHCLENRIDSIFGNLVSDFQGINGFRLTRVDLTRDVRGIPNHYIQQFLLLMRKMPLLKGYELNKELEENSTDFKPENSCNIVNKSQGIEFVLYNKQQAAIDQGYPEKMLEYYQSTLRMELRCNRKYIKKTLKKAADKWKCDTVISQLFYFYCTAEASVEKAYHSTFWIFTKCCFMTSHCCKIKIEKKFEGKVEKIKKMKTVIADLKKNKVCSHRKWMMYFEEIELSPLVIENDAIGFIQAPDSLLGFSPVSEMEKRYFAYAQKHTRDEKKKICLFYPNNSFNSISELS